jgi:hypothetical protein
LYFVGKGIDPKKSKDASVAMPPYLIGYYGVLYIAQHNIANLGEFILEKKLT